MKLADLQAKVEALKEKCLDKISKAAELDDLEKVRVEFLGRKGKVRELMDALPELPPDEKPEAGKTLNVFKNKLSDALESALEKIKKSAGKISANIKGHVKGKASGPIFDSTVPGRVPEIGRLHPITQTFDALKDVFAKLGFSVAKGPEIETEYYNFEALNIPPDHPSRDGFDTFYLKNHMLLRSHTSPVQVHYMEQNKPPIRVIAPGRVYRPDSPDARHFYVFHQLEGLMVDEKVSFADLKAILGIFVREMFGQNTKTRFKPSFFPFTEPSAEMDISCIFCGGEGCKVCSHSGWIEILGAGMVDPNVFKAVGYDHDKYSGFAFGMGIERICMIRYEINDIRLFFENDVRFLAQF